MIFQASFRHELIHKEQLFILPAVTQQLNQIRMGKPS